LFSLAKKISMNMQTKLVVQNKTIKEILSPKFLYLLTTRNNL
jgi:hypothetical protein